MLFDTLQQLQRREYKCYNRTHGSSLSPTLAAMWSDLGNEGQTCGCLQLPVEKVSGTCAFREAKIVGSGYSNEENCDTTIWLLFAGDSTMAPNVEILSEVLEHAGYKVRPDPGLFLRAKKENNLKLNTFSIFPQASQLDCKKRQNGPRERSEVSHRRNAGVSFQFWQIRGHSWF